MEKEISNVISPSREGEQKSKHEIRMERLKNSKGFWESLPEEIKKSFPWMDDPEYSGPSKD